MSSSFPEYDMPAPDKYYRYNYLAYFTPEYKLFKWRGKSYSSL